VLLACDFGLELLLLALVALVANEDHPFGVVWGGEFASVANIRSSEHLF
jgi:hypothetical protein